MHDNGTPAARPVVATLFPLPPDILAALSADFEVLSEPVDNDRTGLVRALLTHSGIGADRRLMDRFPRLEVISNYGVGYDAIDLMWAKARGVTVANSPDLKTDDVADIAIGLTLDVMRGVSRGDRFVRAAHWGAAPTPPTGVSLKGKAMGVVGLGRIGTAIARRAEAFGMRVMWTGPTAKPEVSWPYRSSVAALAADVTVLVLACPGGEKTRHLVNAAVLDALGPEGFLVNVARGSVVDEPALVAALVGGRIAGAGLDVFAAEPAVPKALLGLETVCLQPHSASATLESRGAMLELALDNLRSHFFGSGVRTPVS